MEALGPLNIKMGLSITNYNVGRISGGNLNDFLHYILHPRLNQLIPIAFAQAVPSTPPIKFWGRRAIPLYQHPALTPKKKDGSASYE